MKENISSTNLVNEAVQNSHVYTYVAKLQKLYIFKYVAIIYIMEAAEIV